MSLNLPGAGGGGGYSGVAVDTVDGQATASQVNQIVNEMQESIARIARAAANTTPTWQGRAGAAFDGTHIDWNKSATTLNQTLEQIRTQLTNGFTGYDDHDAAAAGGFGSVPV